jgi:hypothetical protein
MRQTWWIIAFAIVFSGTYANADNFTFSFTGTIGINGNVPGTVTGEIVGLPHNGIGPASQVIITSYSAGLACLIHEG